MPKRLAAAAQKWESAGNLALRKFPLQHVLQLQHLTALVDRDALELPPAQLPRVQNPQPARHPPLELLCLAPSDSRTLTPCQDTRSAAELDPRAPFSVTCFRICQVTSRQNGRRYPASDKGLRGLRPRAHNITSPSHCHCSLQRSTRDGFPPHQLFTRTCRSGAALRSECLCTDGYSVSRQHGNRYVQDVSCRNLSGNQQRAVVPRMVI